MGKRFLRLPPYPIHRQHEKHDASPHTDSLMLIAKLLLVALSMLSATWAGRRFGHRAAGLIAGMPLIMAPLVGLLLIDLSPERAADICWATLANFAACVGYVVVMAWVVIRLSWWQATLVACTAFLAITAAVQLLPVPRPWMVAAGMASILLGPYLVRRDTRIAGGVQVPPIEFVCRLAVAMAIAASVLLLAPVTAPLVSAMLLSFPINGSVLPAFTRALYGGPAARNVLVGFGVGLRGVGLLLFVTAAGLDWLQWPKALAYGAALSSALAYALWVWRADATRVP